MHLADTLFNISLKCHSWKSWGYSCLLFVILLVCPTVFAAETASSSAATTSAGIDSSAWLKAILGLVAVVVLIFVIAFLVKRFSGLSVGGQQQMRIISAMPVGTRERIALIEVADKQLLVGITQHNINLLHTFDEPVINNNDKTGADFSSRLQSILSKGTSA